MTQDEKKRKIKAEEKKLLTLFKGIEPKKLELAKRLIHKTAYQCVTLEEMQEDINENGIYEKFKQGKDQEPYDRRRPVVDAYNAMTSSYQKYIKQLSDLLPKETAKEIDGFEEFVNGRKD